MESGLLRKNESCQVAGDKRQPRDRVGKSVHQDECLAALLTRHCAQGAGCCHRHPGMGLLLTTFQRQAPSIPPGPGAQAHTRVEAP